MEKIRLKYEKLNKTCRHLFVGSLVALNYLKKYIFLRIFSVIPWRLNIFAKMIPFRIIGTKRSEKFTVSVSWVQQRLRHCVSALYVAYTITFTCLPIILNKRSYLGFLKRQLTNPRSALDFETKNLLGFVLWKRKLGIEFYVPLGLLPINHRRCGSFENAKRSSWRMNAIRIEECI